MVDIAVEEQEIEECDGELVRIHQHALLPSEFIAVDERSVDAAQVAYPRLSVFCDSDLGVMT